MSFRVFLNCSFLIVNRILLTIVGHAHILCSGDWVRRGRLDTLSHVLPQPEADASLENGPINLVRIIFPTESRGCNFGSLCLLTP